MRIRANEGPFGGKRIGAGRPNTTGVKSFGFRDWCRRVVTDPAVQALMAAQAATDPDFALKLAEHGFGRPCQAIEVSGPSRGPIRYRAEFPDEAAAPTNGHADATAAALLSAGLSGGQEA